MIDFLNHVRRDGDRLLEAARAAGLDAPVPSCPGWEVRDLVGHVWEVHAHKERIVRDRLQEPPREQQPHPADADLLDEYATGLDRLLTTLRSADPSASVWTWSESNQSVGFWRRRMAQETVIHRVDAELAAGWGSEVDAALATDGIDEILREMLGGVPSWATTEIGDRSVRVVAGERSWTVREAFLSGTSPHSGNTYDRLPMAVVVDGTEAETVLHGSPNDLDLWLWGRGPLDPITVEGDASGAAWLRERAAEDTQ